MKIIGSLTSPYVRKVRIVFAEKKIEVDHALENVWDAKTTISEINPLGKVPCLVLEDGGASKGLGEANWCCGNQFSLADIAVGCALGYLQFRFPQLQWQTQYPNLARLYAKLAQRQSFIETAPP